MPYGAPSYDSAPVYDRTLTDADWGSGAPHWPDSQDSAEAARGAGITGGPQAGHEPQAGARPKQASPAGRRAGGRDRWADPFTDSAAQLPSWALLDAQPSPVQPSPVRADTVQPGTVQPSPVQADTVQADTAQADTSDAQADTVRAGAAGRQDGVRRSRVAVGKKRRLRRRSLRWAVAAVVLIALAAGVIWVLRPRPVAAPGDGFVSVLQHGDLRSIPDACRVLPAATLSGDLAGASGQRMVQPNAGSLLSQCSYTVDKPPVFRVLQVSLQAFRPSLLATGDGSADDSAADAYAALEHQLASPARKTRLPAASMITLTGLGQSAFSGLQVIRSGGDVNDLVTVAVRDRNVLATVTLQALAHASKGRYGPVSAAQLRAAALASARAVLARAAAGPAVG